MQFHAYDIALLLCLVPCVSASRVRLGDKDSDEALFVPPQIKQTEMMAGTGSRSKGIPVSHTTGFEDRPDTTGKEASLRAPAPAIQMPRASVSIRPPPVKRFTGSGNGDGRIPPRRKAPTGGGGGNGDDGDDGDSGNGKPRKRMGKPNSKGFQVFVDMEDTLFCEAGNTGVDRSCYKNEMYPGAFQFMLELSRGPGDSEAPLKVIPFTEKNLHPLSLTAQECKRVGANSGFAEWGLDLLEQILPDSDDNSSTFHAWDNFVSIRPTVFVGDNGHKDQLAAEEMAFQADDRLIAAFIHDVRRDNETSSQPHSKKIHLFETYHDAAKQALELGLISEAGFKSVQRAFEKSTIVQICQNQDMFTDGRYPCIEVVQDMDGFTDPRYLPILHDAETMRTFKIVDVETGKPVSLDLKDGTAYIPDCEAISDFRSPTKPIVPPEAGWSRCEDIWSVTGSWSFQSLTRYKWELV